MKPRNVVFATLLALVAVIALLLYNELKDSDGKTAQETKIVIKSQSYTFGNTTTLQSGDMIKTAMHPDVYRVMYVGDESFKWLMLNPDILRSYTTFDQIHVVTQDVLEAHETSNFGVEVDADGNPTTGLIYFFTSQPNSDVGTKHLVVLTDEQWEELGLNKNSVFKINSFEFNSPSYVEGKNITDENIH